MSMLPIKQTPLLVFFNLLLLIAMFLLMRTALIKPYKVPLLHKKWSIFLMFVFVLFAFWGSDWFHYLEVYPSLLYDDQSHIEAVYSWIAQNLSFGYISFRFIIWGSSLIVLFAIIKHLPISRDLCLLMFCSIWIIWFAYARASLAMVLLYWGVTILVTQYKQRLFPILLGLVIIGCSLFFHKSVGFGVIISLIVLFSLFLKPRFFLFIAVVSIPFLLIIVREYISEFLLMEVSEETLMNNTLRGQYYFGADKRSMGIGELLACILEFAPYYLISFQCFKILKNVRYVVPQCIQFFIRYELLGVFLASIFFFDLGFGDTMTLAVRFLRFMAVPSTILLAFFWEKEYFPKISKYTYRIGFVGLIYCVSYSLYCSLWG